MSTYVRIRPPATLQHDQNSWQWTSAHTRSRVIKRPSPRSTNASAWSRVVGQRTIAIDVAIDVTSAEVIGHVRCTRVLPGWMSRYGDTCTDGAAMAATTACDGCSIGIGSLALLLVVSSGQSTKARQMESDGHLPQADMWEDFDPSLLDFVQFDEGPEPALAIEPNDAVHAEETWERGHKADYDPGARITTDVLESSGGARVVPDSVLAQRLLRTRERNRAAQTRYRNKLKAECEERGRQIAAISTRISNTCRRRELLQETREALTARLAAASHAKLCALRGDSASSHGADGALAKHAKHGGQQGAQHALPVATRLLLARKGTLPCAHHTSIARDPGTALLAQQKRQQLPPSRHVFLPPALMPPALSSFRHQAPVAYRDLLEASGSRTGVVNFGDASAWELMNECMAATVQRLGCAPGEVCWFAQMEMDIGSRNPMSYSCTLSTPECITSCVLFLQALNFEAALISAAHRLSGFRGEPSFSRSGADSATAGSAAGVAEDDARSPKRSRAVPAAAAHLPLPAEVDLAAGVADFSIGSNSGGTQPTSTAEQACGKLRRGSSATAEATAAPAASQRANAAERACRCDAVAGGVCVRLRCGVNETCCAGSAVRHLVRGLYARYRPIVPPAMLREIFDAIRQHTAAMLEAPQDDPHAGGQQGGHASAEEYGQFLAKASMAVFFVLKMLVDTIGDVLAEAAVVDDRRVPSSPCEGGAAEKLRQMPEASTQRESAQSEASTQHQASTAALEARIYEALVSMCMGYQLVQRNAPRVTWTLIAAAVFPRDNFHEFEKFHVHIYRLLGLSEQQKDLYAANWSLWEQRRQAADDHTSRALQQLRTVPASMDLPLPFLRHVSDVAAGALHGDALDFDRSTLDRHARRALDSGPALLGARPADVAAAGESMHALWTMHEADALMITETIDLQIQPGALLEPPQIAQAFGVHLLHGSTPIDFMSICRLAAAERRRAAVARIPDICHAPALPGTVPRELLSSSHEGAASHAVSSGQQDAALRWQ
eukprot:jgi/Ulvmu1/11442/UM076_0016.1